MARAMGVHVVPLDMSQPFSAARGRNEGWKAALALKPDLRFIQFVDGDCEIVPGWVSQARQSLVDHPAWSAVCGRRQERHPDHSVYNRLCDIEWNTPVGASKHVGGDAMMRVSTLLTTQGYREDVVAGEEPELCVRIRQKGGQIWRLDAPMTLHDANLTRLGQWWTRAKRGGYAYALGVKIHGKPPERHWVKEYRRAITWGAALPLACLVASMAVPFGALSWLLFPLQWARLGFKAIPGKEMAWPYATFSILGKFAEAQGCMRFWIEQISKRGPSVIEYK